jgi:hypothetical protein
MRRRVAFRDIGIALCLRSGLARYDRHCLERAESVLGSWKNAGLVLEVPKANEAETNKDDRLLPNHELHVCFRSNFQKQVTDLLFSCDEY